MPPCDRAAWSPSPAEQADSPTEKTKPSGDCEQDAREAWNTPSWRKAAREYRRARAGHALIVENSRGHLTRMRRLVSDEVSLDCAWNEINHAARERYNEARKATYDAVVYELRTYGLSQLSKVNCQRRLSDLPAAQIKHVIASLQQRRAQYPKVCDELLITLATIYDARLMADA